MSVAGALSVRSLRRVIYRRLTTVYFKYPTDNFHNRGKDEHVFQLSSIYFSHVLIVKLLDTLKQGTSYSMTLHEFTICLSRYVYGSFARASTFMKGTSNNT
jgi:hypothetical protein